MMIRALPPLLLATLLLPLTSLHAERVLFEEDFSSYPAGPLEGEQWPGPLPASGASWQFGRGNHAQSIVADDHTSGQVFRFIENSPEHLVNYSYLRLPESPGSDAAWKLSIRFYVEAMESPAIVSIIGLYEGDVLSESSRAQGRVTSFSLSRNSRTGEIQAFIAREGGETYFRERLSVHKWYTLEISGNNADHTLHFSLRDGSTFSDQLSGLSYAVSVQRFDHLVIGDATGNKWDDGRDNSILIDDLKLTEQ